MNRIKEIAKYIEPYKYIADVGCDHGYLIKEAIDNYGVNAALAIDNKIGPLNSAMFNLRNYKGIDYLLSDGIEDLNESVEVVIIAGMGGDNIVKILKKKQDKLANVKRLIIQANRNTNIVRKYCSDNGFKIVCEEVIEELGIFYEIIVLEKGISKYNDDELFFGPILLKEKRPLFIEKWSSIVNELEQKKNKHLNKKIDYIKQNVF